MFERIAVPRIKKSPVFLIFMFSAAFLLAPAAGAHLQEEEKSVEEVPRGIYHFSDTDRDIETVFKIPNFEALDPIKVASDLMASAMKVDTKRKTLAGIQMPFSFTGRPMSLQINGESHDAVSLVDNPNKRKESEPVVRRSDMSAESRKAFLRARQVCLEQSADSCDQALDTFHRVRYGKSLLVPDGEDVENDQYRNIIEQRLKEVEKTSPSSSLPHSEGSVSSHHSDRDEMSESESVEESEDVEEGEDIHTTSSLPSAAPPSNRFSYITLPKYHDKANNFLNDINNHQYKKIPQ